MRRLTPFLVNLAIASVFRLLLPTTLAEGGERYLYYMMSLFFPFTGCTVFQCFRFLPPLFPSLLPFEVIDSFIIAGFACQVLTGTLLWHIAERFHASRRVALLTTCAFWVVWAPLPTLRDPMLIADPVQALWLVTALLLLIDERYLLALPVLISGAGVKESVLTVPVVYAAYLVLAGENIRRRIPWLAALIVLPVATWMIVRRVLMGAFGYAPPGDSQYLANPYLFGLWLQMLAPWPRNLMIAGLYIFAGFGAMWIFGALGLWHSDRRMRALTAASAPAMAFLALYQEPHRAVACFPWAVLIPAAAYLESLPTPLIAAVFVVNAAFTIRMSAAVTWLPNSSVLLAILIALVVVCVYVKRAPGHRGSVVAAPPSTARAGWYTAVVPVALALFLMLVVGYRFAVANAFHESTIAPPASGAIAIDDAGAAGLALAPDETRLVFTGRRGSDAPQLWLGRLDAATPEPVAGTMDATSPFWSPDARAIGFFAAGRLKRVDLVSHEVRDLAGAAEPYGGAWAPDGTILFAAGQGAPLQRVSATGGAVTNATTLDPSLPRSSHRWPHLLPDGRQFLFTETGPAAAENAIRLGSLASPESRPIMKDAYDAVYVRPGLVFFGREDSVRVQPFDLRRLMSFPEDMATSLPIDASPNFRRAALSVSERTLAYARHERRPPLFVERAQPKWYDRSGQVLDSAGNADSVDRVASPDGRQIAMTVRTAGAGTWAIVTASANGGGAHAIAADVPGGASPTSWSPDGRVVLYQTTRGEESGVWAAPVDGGAPPTRLFSDASQAAHAQFSPDGRWIAYSAVERRHRHIYVEPYPPTGARFTVSTDGGEQPRWRADGREIVYLVEDRYVTSVAIRAQDGFHFDSPRRLFTVRAPRSIERRFQMAMVPDGQRLLINTVSDPEVPPHLDAITNWTRALRLTKLDTRPR